MSNNKHGVKYNELKYALRINLIIKAIEEKYGLSFSSDFFNNSGNDAFNNLYMWLHRVKGKITSGGQVELSVFNVNTFTNDSSNDGSFMNNNILKITDGASFRNQSLEESHCPDIQSWIYKFRITFSNSWDLLICLSLLYDADCVVLKNWTHSAKRKGKALPI